MLDSALIMLLAFHLLAVDLAMAGPLVSVWLEWRAVRNGEASFDSAARALARASTWGLAGGIAMGAGLLAVRWWRDDANYLAAVSDLPRSRLWFAGAELLFYFACMGVYVGLWQRLRKHRLVHRALAVAAATNLLVHFPALFVIISVLSARGGLIDRPLTSAGFRALLVDPEVISRVAHVVVAAFAVAGGAVMAYGMQWARNGAHSAATAQLVRGGATLALVATVVQLPLGVWLAMALPEQARAPILGGDPVVTGLFLVALAASLALMHYLAAVAMGEPDNNRIRSALTALLVVVLMMVATRYHADLRQRTAPAGAGDARPREDLHVAAHRLQ